MTIPSLCTASSSIYLNENFIINSSFRKYLQYFEEFFRNKIKARSLHFTIPSYIAVFSEYGIFCTAINNLRTTYSGGLKLYNCSNTYDGLIEARFISDFILDQKIDQIKNLERMTVLNRGFFTTLH